MVTLAVIIMWMEVMRLGSRKISLGQIVLPTVIPGGVQIGVSINYAGVSEQGSAFSKSKNKL
jgi:hypothetical protein